MILKINYLVGFLMGAGALALTSSLSSCIKVKDE